MNHTVVAAGSRGRVAVVALETFHRSGVPKPVRVVKSAQRMRPTASAADTREVVYDLCRTLYGGAENTDLDHPQVVVAYSAFAGALFEMLYEDNRLQSRTPDEDAGRPRLLLPRRPLGLSTSRSVNDPRVQYVTPNNLASWFYREWQSGRVEFAAGLDRLRQQFDAFVPVITKSGALELGNEDMKDYDDITVAVMMATAASGAVHSPSSSGRLAHGELRYEDSRGDVWVNRQTALARLGGSEGHVTRLTSFDAPARVLP